MKKKIIKILKNGDFYLTLGWIFLFAALAAYMCNETDNRLFHTFISIAVLIMICRAIVVKDEHKL